MSTSPYYVLSVGGAHVKTHYVKDETEWVDPKPDLAIAWLEGKSKTRKHYFLFFLGASSLLV